MIIQPVPGMTLQQWADGVVLYLSQFDSIERLDTNDWRSWGARLRIPLTLSGLNLPDPYGFSTWQDWAERLAEELT